MPAQLYKNTNKKSKQLKTKQKKQQKNNNKQTPKPVTSLNIVAWAICKENQIQLSTSESGQIIKQSWAKNKKSINN